MRGAKVGFVFQDPMTSLNPVFSVGMQIMEPLRKHLGMDQARRPRRGRWNCWNWSASRMRATGCTAYPHQFSGGMRQRVMIAIALACDPDVLIADEPTTALDVTIQAQILELVKDLRQKLGMAIIWITHDLGVIAGIADRVMVMYGGQVVEQAPVKELFANPQHPYTRALLLKTIPKITGDREARLKVIEGQPPIMLRCAERLPVPRALRIPPCGLRPRPIRRAVRSMASRWAWVMTSPATGTPLPGPRWPMRDAAATAADPAGPLVQVEDLKMYFPIYTGVLRRHTGDVKAVDGVSFSHPARRDAGAGRRIRLRQVHRRAARVCGYTKSTDGRVVIDGEDVAHLSAEKLRRSARPCRWCFRTRRPA